MGEVLAIAALVIYSCNIVVTKVASGRLDLNFGFLISVSMNVLFATVLFGGQLLIRQGDLHWDGYGFFLFVLAGIFSTYLGRWFFFDSIAKLGPAKASTFQTSNPLFTVIIAWLFLDESLSLLDIGAIATILFGLFLTSYVPGPSPSRRQRRRGTSPSRPRAARAGSPRSGPRRAPGSRCSRVSSWPSRAPRPTRWGTSCAEQRYRTGTSRSWAASSGRRPASSCTYRRVP
ncbi:EamA family transporter [Rubrobacter marinus]|uniref:EamA family transporter n=1 Tax=Rubrobacter marinus TaxID=2653852 RepID=A0A6G8Q0M2_9ACTN|nr:EamA family transporter [Rubrobacter marinus]